MEDGGLLHSTVGELHDSSLTSNSLRRVGRLASASEISTAPSQLCDDNCVLLCHVLLLVLLLLFFFDVVGSGDQTQVLSFSRQTRSIELSPALRGGVFVHPGAGQEGDGGIGYLCTGPLAIVSAGPARAGEIRLGLAVSD